MYQASPIAHICGFTVAISTEYANYMEFSEEIRAVLTNKSNWIMDVITDD